MTQPLCLAGTVHMYPCGRRIVALEVPLWQRIELPYNIRVVRENL